MSALKLDGIIGKNVLLKINSLSKRLSSEFISETFIYYHAAPIFWCKALLDLSALTCRSLNIADSYKRRSVSKISKDFAFVLLNSTLFFYFWVVQSDCYNLTQRYFSLIKIPQTFQDNRFADLSKKLSIDLVNNMKVAEYCYKNKGNVRFAQFFPKLSKPIIDEIDKVLAKHYGFTEEELDFIINYDIKYRMGDELNSEDGE